MRHSKKTKLGLHRESLVELARDDLHGVAGGVAPVPKTMYGCPPKTCGCCGEGGQP